MSSRIRCGIFSCPSGANVSWSRAPPPKVMTTTFRLLVEIPARAIRLEGSRELPSATPAALRKNSRRLQASCRASSWGADALVAARRARSLAVCSEQWELIANGTLSVKTTTRQNRCQDPSEARRRFVSLAARSRCEPTLTGLVSFPESRATSAYFRVTESSGRKPWRGSAAARVATVRLVKGAKNLWVNWYRPPYGSCSTVSRNRTVRSLKRSGSPIPRSQKSAVACCITEPRAVGRSRINGLMTPRTAMDSGISAIGIPKLDAIGEFPVHDDVGGETDAQQLPSAAQQTLPGSVFAVPRSIWFNVKRERQPRPHHAGQDQVVPIAHDLVLGIAVGTAKQTSTASAPSDGGSIHGQADPAAGFECLVALGLVKDARQGGPCGSRI